MRLVIFVFQLNLFMRSEAQIPEACTISNTNRPPENSDITVVCGTEYMDLSIYLCPMYQAFYNETLMVLNNQINTPECYGTADWSVDPPVLKFRFPMNESAVSSCNNNFKIINEVGTAEFADFSNVQFVNISGTVTSIDPTLGMITYRRKILYKFSCFYPMQYLLNNTQLSVSGSNLAIQDNNGSFISTLSMQLYQDELYQEMLSIPQTGLSLNTMIYVAVKATNLTDRFNVLLDRCYASTRPYPMLNTYYDLFVGCQRDKQTKVELNGVSQEAHFSFETFRFVEHKNQTVSTFYLHCVTRLCEASSCSSLMPDCGASLRRWKREAEYVSSSTTITSPAILVGNLSTGVTVGLRPTNISSSYQTEEKDKYKSTSSLSCYSSPVVMGVIVCNVLLSICFSV
ncbi:zona pellucida-like domain-containing protein 1 [Cottoperca gobio]|uniref:Zona pellucida-like domain-containing protein 1 n=1 Tax=Cottoperca gobio TaxID=56716 RepID=A0A6J2QYT8_COTGO|nr:zona pellucida-like domain-containing protein 1 [Cottoperca gobio]